MRLSFQVGKNSHTKEWTTFFQKIWHSFFNPGNLAYLQPCEVNTFLYFQAFSIYYLKSQNKEYLYLFHLYLESNQIANLAPRAVSHKLGIFQQLRDRTYNKFLTFKFFPRIHQWFLIFPWKLYASRKISFSFHSVFKHAKIHTFQYCTIFSSHSKEKSSICTTFFKNHPQ